METASRSAQGDGARTALMGLTALLVVFGMQCLRVFLPMLGFLLRDRFEWSTPQLALLALAIFLPAFFVPWALRPLGLRRSLWLAAGGLVAARLGIQLWSGDPVGDLWFACAGVVLFVLTMPLLLLVARDAPDRDAAGETLAAGWLQGLLADLVLHVLYGSWDVAWRDGVLHVLVVAALGAVAWLFLIQVGRSVGDAWPGVAGNGAAAWAGVWPLMFLYLGLLMYPARMAAVSGSFSGPSNDVLLPLVLAAGASSW